MNDRRQRHSVRLPTRIVKRWWLAMRTPRIRWVLTPEALKPYAPGVWDPDVDPVELYYLPDDFTQAYDLASENPEKVEELKKLFWKEARELQRAAVARHTRRLLRHAATAA
jgi:arylsulfatase A-like enzyme